MSKKADPILVQYKTGKHLFEVVVHHESGLLESYRASPSAAQLTRVLDNDKIYTSFQKGQIASSDELRSVFDVKSHNEILDIILREGVAQQSTGDKRAAATQHRSSVLDYLAEHYVNKTTRLPVDTAELSKAVDDSKVHIPDGDIAAAAATTAHSLLGKLSLKEADITGSVEMKAELVGPALGIILKYTKIKQETQYMFGDEMKYRVAIKPGDYAQFRAALDKATKGAYNFVLGQLELHEHEEAAAAAAAKDHGTMKKEERANSKTAQLADAVVKQDQKQHKQADEARARKAGGGDE